MDYSPRYEINSMLSDGLKKIVRYTHTLLVMHRISLKQTEETSMSGGIWG